MDRSLTSQWFKSLLAFSHVQKSQQNLLNSVATATKRARQIATDVIAKSAIAAATRLKQKNAVRAKPAISYAPDHQSPHFGTEALTGSWTCSYTNGSSGHRMSYWLYLPKCDAANEANATQPLPLVVMLHGCTQTAPEFAEGTRMNALAQRKGFAVLYPQQLVTVDANRCWQWYQRATQQGSNEAEQVADMLSHVVAKHALDASRVYLAGMSAGAALASIIALRYPYRVAAVGMHSSPVFGMADNRLQAFGVMQTGAGSVSGLLHAVEPFVAAQDFPVMPAMLLHGDADVVVRVANVVQLAKQFCAVNGLTEASPPPIIRTTPANAGGRNPHYAFQTQNYKVGGKTRISVCSIAGLDHAWSGGDSTLRFNDSMGPDASALLWAFFAKHRRLS